MKLLVNKEIRLTTSSLSWLFLAFSLMVFLPGYPIAMGAFFICLGLFQSYRKAREAQDILYSSLLPIAKRDVVTAKYAVVVLLEALGMAAMVAFSVVRMTALTDVPVYVHNALLPANLSFLSCVLLVFASFNVVFLRGFFKTAYNFGRPFVAFMVVSLLIVLAFEVVWQVPGFGMLGTVQANAVQAGLLAASAAACVLGTFASSRASQRSFEVLDIV